MLFYYYNGSNLGAEAVRLGPTGFSLTEAAESGILGFGRLRIDDPTSSLSLVGHRALNIQEPDCSDPWLFRGYLADRMVKHEDSLNIGTARVWDCTLVDLNSGLQFRVIRSGGKRPEETDTQRLAWLLGSGYMGPVSEDDSHVFGAGVDLDAADYRGQTPADVLADCAQVSGCNYFVVWDDTLGDPALHYYLPSRAHFDSTLSISNVLADVNMTTVFAPDEAMTLSMDPSRIYTGVRYGYGDKEGAVFEESATILASIGHRREANWADPSIRKAARATAKANKWLSEGETEATRITVTLNAVPPAQVNLIRCGQRLQVKATHLPGFTSFTWVRVVRRTVQQMEGTQLLYSVALELSNVKQAASRVRHKPVPVAPTVEDGATIAFTRNAFEAGQEVDDCQGGLADDFTYGASPPGATTIRSSSDHFTPGIFVGGGCNSPAVGYSGIGTHETWLEIDGTPSADAVGLKVSYTVGTVEGVAAGNVLLYGVASVAPSDQRGAFTVLGQCSADADDSFIVPLSLIGTGGFIVMGPGWQCSNLGNACSDEVGDPTDTGAGNSGQVDIDTIDIIEVTIGGAGLTLWRMLDGDIDGTNRTYSLPDWDGTGTPRLRIGAVEYAAGIDYTLDEDALTATFRFAPWEGADLQGRWNT